MGDKRISEHHSLVIVEKLPLFGNSIGWRSGRSAVPRGASAADVVRYECNELGNESEYEHLSPPALKDLENYDALWVTRTKAAARRYGDPMPVEVPPGARVIADDQEGGYLLAIPCKKTGTLAQTFERAVLFKAQPL
jgi:hypothetical protein